MLQLEFEYFTTYDAGKPGIDLDVSIQLTGSRVDFVAKLDTGSSRCIFERALGEELGLNVESGMQQRFGTATDTFLAYGHELTLVVADFAFDSMVFFPENENIKRNVLGRTGWLDRIILGLVDYEGKIYLSRYF
jgi:hypothetical protein